MSCRSFNVLLCVSQPFNWHHPGMSLSKRKLLQSLMGPYGPLSVSYNGKTCILFKAKRLAIRYRNHTFIDLTERVFNPNSPVDTKGSICTKEKATLVKAEDRTRCTDKYYSNGFLFTALFFVPPQPFVEVWRCGGPARPRHQVKDAHIYP